MLVLISFTNTYLNYVHIADHPILVEEKKKKASFYVETDQPGSWWDLETSCVASQGHLVSVSDG